jgi:hypothetical protein
MTTKLTKPIRRELEIDGETYTLTVSGEGIRLTRKRFRSGRALSWRAFLAGEGGRAMEAGVGAEGD